MLSKKDKIRIRIAAKEKAAEKRGIHLVRLHKKAGKHKKIMIKYYPGQSITRHLDPSELTLNQLKEYLANQKRKSYIKIYE